jgi:hypothetical protein
MIVTLKFKLQNISVGVKLHRFDYNHDRKALRLHNVFGFSSSFSLMTTSFSVACPLSLLVLPINNKLQFAVSTLQSFLYFLLHPCVQDGISLVMSEFFCAFT